MSTDSVSRFRVPLPIVGFVVPAVVFLAAVIGALLVAPDRDVIVHWSADGHADGWAPAWTVVVGLAALGVVGALSFGLPLLATRREAPTALMKFLAATAVAYAVLLATLGLWILVAQRDPDATPAVGPALALAFGAAIAAGVVAWFVTPRAVPVTSSSDPVAPLPLREGERAVWVGRARFGTAALLALAGAVVASLGAAVVATLATDGAAAAVFVAPVAVLGIVVATGFWVVRVDATGLEVRNPLGWPVFRMPAHQVAAARVVEVQAIAGFGGWGVRAGTGRRLGIVMRSGSALEAQNRDGGALVVTVDDAGTAAALLAAVAERAATASGR